MPKHNGKIEPNGSPPYEHSFFKWGSTNPEMVEETNRLMQHREQERIEQGEESPKNEPRCSKG